MTVRSSTPRARAVAASACSPGGWLIAGSFRTPKRRPEGTISVSTSSRFASSSVTIRLIPVRLPPGLARLAISPEATRSLVLAKIGIVRVAACAARGRLTLGDDNARLVPDQRRCYLGETPGIALCEAEIEADVAAIEEPERRQRIPDPRGRRLDGVRRVDAQDADKRQVVGFLRQCRDGDA